MMASGCDIKPCLPLQDCAGLAGPSPEMQAGDSSRYRSSARGRRALASGCGRGGGLSSGGSRRRLEAELFLLGLDELTIVRRIEVEKRPARSKMLDESLADRIGGAGREHRHRQRRDRGT